MALKNGVRWTLCLLCVLAVAPGITAGQDILRSLAQPQDYTSRRISSYDRTGGNADSLSIEAGATAVLAELKGPGAIHHIWLTVAAEPFYGRKLVLRFYWDGESTPSVEAPLGDFFGVGHGLNRNLRSLPIANSSEGRARNCYWYMPFARSARLTVTNEGSRPVAAFYYYIDYRELGRLAGDTSYFHARYRQETPCRPDGNYLLLEASGRGHYVGANLSVLQQSAGWWGEGDDMIFVDGERAPSLHGTGSEDYFSDAWGMREGQNLFYGCPLQEEDFQVGSKATVHRFHIPDPIPFTKSIRVEIEHGHANNLADYFSSVAYWYQGEPHRPFPALPPAAQRLPFAWETPAHFLRPSWTEEKVEAGTLFIDEEKALSFKAARAEVFDSPFYGRDGGRYPVLRAGAGGPEDMPELSFPVEIPDLYDIDLYLLKAPGLGNIPAVSLMSGDARRKFEGPTFYGSSAERKLDTLKLRDVALSAGSATLSFELTKSDAGSNGSDLGFIGLGLTPSQPRYLTDWNVIGPFDAPDMTSLTTVYPPEQEIALKAAYRGKDGQEVKWTKLKADGSGYMRLDDRIRPNEQALVYALGYVYAPRDMDVFLLAGSDDGLRVWINGKLVHSNPVSRPAVPDEDKVRVHLHPGWNACLLKDVQGGGEWGFYARFADPEGVLRWQTDPPDAR